MQYTLEHVSTQNEVGVSRSAKIRIIKTMIEKMLAFILMGTGVDGMLVCYFVKDHCFCYYDFMVAMTS